jgi:hypothetical protein
MSVTEFGDKIVFSVGVIIPSIVLVSFIESSMDE